MKTSYLNRLLLAASITALLTVSMAAQNKDKDGLPTQLTLNPGARALIELNTISADQLKTLPGLPEADQKKILDGKPYQRKEDLVTKKVISQATFDKIKDLIIVSPP